MIGGAAGVEQCPQPEKTLQQVHIAGPAALSLGPHDPADPLLLEMSEAGRVLFVALAAPVGESQHSPIGFWSRALTSSGDNYSVFERLKV